MKNVLMEDFEELLKLDIPFETFKNKTFYVTGATGLVGSVFIRFLLFLNDEKDMNINIVAAVRNIEKAKKIFGDQYEKVTFDVLDLGNKKSSYQEKIDYIIHAAAVTTSKLLVEKPVEAMRTAINGTEDILQLALNNNVDGMVYVSSMEIYGQKNTSELTNEEQLGKIDLSNVRSGYPESKRICELMCTSYANEYNVNVMSARLAQTFGAGVLPGENRVFAQFARSAVNGEDIILHTEGKSEGNYIYTSEVVSAFLYLLLYGKKGEAYNVANPKNHLTIKEMAELVADNFSDGRSKVIIDIPEDTQNLGYAPDTKLWLSNEKLSKLGWKPQVDLLSMYRNLIEWRKEIE